MYFIVVDKVIVYCIFMTTKPEHAWQAFLSRAASAKEWTYWSAALVGHHLEGATAQGLKDWFSANALNEVRIDGADASTIYLHSFCVTDRLPTDADIAVLREPHGKRKFVSAKWATSAMLTRSALEDKGYKEAFQQAVLTLSPGVENNDFIRPLFAWIAWQATEGKDANLDEVRQATVAQLPGNAPDIEAGSRQ